MFYYRDAYGGEQSLEEIATQKEWLDFAMDMEKVKLEYDNAPNDILAVSALLAELGSKKRAAQRHAQEEAARLVARLEEAKAAARHLPLVSDVAEVVSIPEAIPA